MPTLYFPTNDTPALNAYTRGFANQNDDYIAEKVLPVTQVPGSIFKFKVVDEKNYFQIPPGMQIGSLGKFPNIDLAYTYATGQTYDYGVSTDLANQDVYDERDLSVLAFKLKTSAINSLIETQMLRYELAAATFVNNVSNYATANKKTLNGTGSGGSDYYWWSDQTNSDPIPEIKRKMLLSKVSYKYGATSAKVWHYLSTHPKVIQYVKNSTQAAGDITPRQFANSLGLIDLFVGKAKYNTALPGKTPVIDYMWGAKFALLAINSYHPMIGTMTFGFTASYQPTGQQRVVLQNVLESIENGIHGGLRLGVGEQKAPCLVSDQAGFLWTDAIDPAL